MKKTLGITALIFLILAAGSVVLWMAGVSAMVTGGGRSTNEAEGLLTFAQISFVLFCIAGVSSFIVPAKKISSATDSAHP